MNQFGCCVNAKYSNTGAINILTKLTMLGILIIFSFVSLMNSNPAVINLAVINLAVINRACYANPMHKVYEKVPVQ